MLYIGVGESEGVAVLPPQGLSPNSLDNIQKWIRGHCNRLDPVVQPILSPEIVAGKHILVIWMPASEARPHQAPVLLSGGDRTYYVRLGSETVEAKGKIRTDLLSMCAKIPFDDRRANQFTLDDLRVTLVREFLSEVGSRLFKKTDDREIYRHLKLTVRVNDHEVPKNVALLFFADDPEMAFSGARIEVVYFPDDASGHQLQEWIFRGPLPRQIKDCMTHLRNLTGNYIQKHADRIETSGWVSYPSAALEETIVNAVYHRSYEGNLNPPRFIFFRIVLKLPAIRGRCRVWKRPILPDNGCPLSRREIGALVKC